MTADDAKTLGEMVTLGVIGGYTALKARKAAQQTVATGNGFAKFVMDTLIRLENKVDQHIASHADADVHKGQKK